MHWKPAAPQVLGPLVAPAEVGPVLEHHERFCRRMPWKPDDLIKPKSEQIKGNYVPTAWAPATLSLPGDVLVAFGCFSHKGLQREKQPFNI